jgi:hypothetical protein
MQYFLIFRTLNIYAPFFGAQKTKNRNTAAGKAASLKKKGIKTK